MCAGVNQPGTEDEKLPVANVINCPNHALGAANSFLCPFELGDIKMLPDFCPRLLHQHKGTEQIGQEIHEMAFRAMFHFFARPIGESYFDVCHRQTTVTT